MEQHLNDIEPDMAESVCVQQHDSLRRDLNAMRLKNEFTNITFQVGCHEFRAHRSVVASQMESFRKMFESKSVKSSQALLVVDPEVVDPDVFEDILGFIYLNKIRLTRMNCKAICMAADHFQLPVLREIAEEYLAARITNENFLELFNLAKAIGLTKLLSAIEKIVSRGLAQQTTSPACLYFIGGNHRLSSMSKWSPYTKNFSKLPSMPTPQRSSKAATIKNRIYVVGYNGENDFKSLNLYDPQTNKWSVRASMYSKKPIFDVAALDGQLYVGESNESNEPFSLERYDPPSRTWETLAQAKRLEWCIDLLACSGKLYAIGSTGKTFVMERYTPNTDTWEDVDDLSHEEENVRCSTVFNNKIYICTTKCVFQEFDPENETWTILSESPDGFLIGKLTVIDERLLLIEEKIEEECVTLIHEFDFPAKKWKLLDEFIINRTHYALAVVSE